MSGYPRPTAVAAVPLRDLAVVAGASPSAPAGELSTADGDRAVTGVTHDSSSVRSGDLYVALQGARRHGAEFARDAVRAGAAAILTDDAGSALSVAAGVPVLVTADPRAALGPVAAVVYGDPTARLPVIGITGTAGKTSTAYLIESGLAAAGHTTAMVGTVETRIAGQTIDSVRTTPEATDLHALLAVALERGATAAVMEVSSHALTYGRVGGVRFAVGGFTNFGLDHLDFHADVDEYFAAKAKLFDGRCRAEILNLDDPAVRRLVAPGRLTFSASGDPDATWRAEDVTPEGFGRGGSRSEERGSRTDRSTGYGQRFIAVHPLGRTPAQVALPGRHNVANALLALAALVEVGVDPATAAAGVAACRGVPGRLEQVGPAESPILGVVDYAHKPDAIVAALAALRETGPGRLICVIGAGGDRDKGKRPFMGEASARGADVVIVTDDNPRSEDPAAIRAEVLIGAVAAPGAGRVIEVAGRREAIAEAVALAAPGDVVAVLGKGHERGQEVAGVVSPFDDRVELAAALQTRLTGVPA